MAGRKLWGSGRGLGGTQADHVLVAVGEGAGVRERSPGFKIETVLWRWCCWCWLLSSSCSLASQPRVRPHHHHHLKNPGSLC